MRGKGASIGRRRRAARIAAVQALYQMALNGGDADDVIAEFVAFRLHGDEARAERRPEADLELFADIVRGATARRASADAVIGEALDKDRQVGRLEILMQSILRAGTYELLARPDIDTALTISEYVAVADAFYNEREPALVNAVLDRVARALALRPAAETIHDIAQDG
jgi:N utilization substance protein B